LANSNGSASTSTLAICSSRAWCVRLV
jgi:hypothetical protein